MKVYSRNTSKKHGGGKEIRNNPPSLTNDDNALLGVSEDLEGEEGNMGFSSSCDGTSSEEFNFTSDFEDETTK